MSELLGLCGALRAESTNRKLLVCAARSYGEPLVMGDMRLPLYDGDVEAEGIPAAVRTLADGIAQADAVIISGPEYNKGISGVLKNALDWVSRTEGKPWRGKPVAIMSATAGRAGGERTQTMLRACLAPFAPRVIPMPEVLIAASRNAFDEEGRLTNELSQRGLDTLMQALRDEVALLKK